MEKIQYSLIYMLYKTRYYKSGKGYIYRANQLMSIILTSLLTLLFWWITGREITGSVLFISFICLALLIFFLLEKNVTKQKLLKHRSTYLQRNKYLALFFSCMLLIIIHFLLLFKLAGN